MAAAALAAAVEGGAGGGDGGIHQRTGGGGGGEGDASLAEVWRAQRDRQRARVAELEAERAGCGRGGWALHARA